MNSIAVKEQLYSQEQLNSACEILGIHESDKERFREIIEQAAYQYIIRLTPTRKPLPNSAKQSKLESLANHLNKSKQLYKELTAPENKVNFLGGFQECDSDHEKAFWLLYGEYYQDMVIDSELLEGVLDVLENVTRKAWDSDIFDQYKDNTLLTATFHWICNITVPAEQIISIHLAEGTYNNKLAKHNSPAVRLFGLLSEPINKSVPTGRIITNSLINKALVMHRKATKKSAIIVES